MANMIPISTVTVGSGGVTNIQFTGISQSYTDLLILLSVRSAYNGLNDSTLLRFNNDSGNNYSYRVIQGDGSSASSFSGSSTAQIFPANINGATSTSNTFANLSIYIPNYTSSNYKSVSCDSAEETNATTIYADLIAGLWSSTAPINSILIQASNGNMVQYSSATLYGIRKY
jgi:hypothetical protein